MARAAITGDAPDEILSPARARDLSNAPQSGRPRALSLSLFLLRPLYRYIYCEVNHSTVANEQNAAHCEAKSDTSESERNQPKPQFCVCMGRVYCYVTASRPSTIPPSREGFFFF